MRLKFLVTDDVYTIEEAIDKGLLKMGGWFEFKGDIYYLAISHEIERVEEGYRDPYIAYKVRKEILLQEDACVYRLAVNEIPTKEQMVEMYRSNYVGCYFSRWTEIRVVDLVMVE